MGKISTDKNSSGKYSEVTGEKIKKKRLGRLKKEHKKQEKLDKQETKKFNKRKKKVDKKLNKKTDVVMVESKTISQNELSFVNEDVNSEALKNIGAEKKQEGVQEVLIVRKTERGKPKTKAAKVRSFMSYVLVGFAAIFFGYIAGNFYIANVLNKVNYDFSEASLRDDGQAIYQTIVGSGKSLDKFSASELFVAAEYNLGVQENYYATTLGAIQPSIGSKQDIWGYKKKTGNIYECESASKGMMSLAEKYFYDTTTQTATIYKASKVSTSGCSYPSSPTWTMSLNEYRDEYGTSPDAPCVPYVISSKTVIEGTDSVKSIGGGKYQVSFSLTKDSSVMNYVKQVKHMSGLKDYPVFKNIIITAIIDSDLKFTYLRYDEAYSVMYFGVMATCSGFVESNVTY